MKNKSKKPILIGLGVMFLIFLMIYGYVSMGSITYSEGERTGVITKFSHKGLMMKTWEGELNVGGIDQGGVPTMWQFSVNDPEIVQDLQNAQRKGGRWTLSYRQQLWTQSWKGQTEYFIVGVQSVDETKKEFP